MIQAFFHGEIPRGQTPLDDRLEAIGNFPDIGKSKHQMKREWHKFRLRTPVHEDAGHRLTPKARHGVASGRGGQCHGD